MIKLGASQWSGRLEKAGASRAELYTGVLYVCDPLKLDGRTAAKYEHTLYVL